MPFIVHGCNVVKSAEYWGQSGGLLVCIHFDILLCRYQSLRFGIYDDALNSFSSYHQRITRLMSLLSLSAG